MRQAPWAQGRPPEAEPEAGILPKVVSEFYTFPLDSNLVSPYNTHDAGHRKEAEAIRLHHERRGQEDAGKVSSSKR